MKKKFKKGDIVLHQVIYSSANWEYNQKYSKGKVVENSDEHYTTVEWGDGKLETNSTNFLDLCNAADRVNHPQTNLFK